MFKLRGEGRVTKCVCGTSTTSTNTNLINFPMQILDLLISCADTCSHTVRPANSRGTHGGLVCRHFTKPRKNSYLFLLVTIVTLYSRGDSRLICSLGMQIPSLSFAIENANTFRSKTLTNMHKPLHNVWSSCCCLIICYLSNLKQAFAIRYVIFQSMLLQCYLVAFSHH